MIDICYKNDEQARIEAEHAGRPQPPEVLTKLAEIVPPSEPLEMLVERLRGHSPISIDHLIRIFMPVEGIIEFSELIRRYLPDMEKEIMGISNPAEQMATFAEAFSDRYFPIVTDEGYYESSEEGDNYYNLTNECPAEFSPITSDDYDRISTDGEPHEIVLAYILENPWAMADKAAFAEAAVKLIPESLIKLVPDEGFELDGLEEWLKDTEFEPVAFWGKVISHQTGNEWFDCGTLEDEGAQFNVAWNLGTVNALTKKWQEFEAWQEKWSAFTNNFEKNLAKNTEKLIRILRERSGLNGGEKDWPNPELDPNQGRLIDILPNGTSVAGSAGTPDTAGQAPGPFGLL